VGEGARGAVQKLAKLQKKEMRMKYLFACQNANPFK
jgi:hypothetical protein